MNVNPTILLQSLLMLTWLAGVIVVARVEEDPVRRVLWIVVCVFTSLLGVAAYFLVRSHASRLRTD